MRSRSSTMVTTACSQKVTNSIRTCWPKYQHTTLLYARKVLYYKDRHVPLTSSQIVWDYVIMTSVNPFKACGILQGLPFIVSTSMQLYRTERLHPLAYPVISIVLRKTIKDTPCICATSFQVKKPYFVLSIFTFRTILTFSAPVQTGPEAHPASCTMGTGSFPGVRCGRGVTLTPHPFLVPRSKIE